MRRLTWLLLVVACGGGEDDAAVTTDGDSVQGDGDDARSSSITYPDSFCDERGCTYGECDPDGRDDARVDCNAWQVVGHFGLSAVAVQPDGERGPPVAPQKADDDPCPGASRTPEGVTGAHCCQRVDDQGDAPAFKLTGLAMDTPPVFRNGSVAATNRSAIEQDRYNWIMQLDRAAPGPVTITSGLGLTNVDGSYAFAEGPFAMGGKRWNDDGAFDWHAIEGELTQHEDGHYTLAYRAPYVPEAHGRTFELPMWGDNLEFTMLVLSMTGISMSIDLDADMLCGGAINPAVAGDFSLVGELRAYLPLEALRGTILHLSQGDSGVPLCMLTAQVRDCSGPVYAWQPSR